MSNFYKNELQNASEGVEKIIGDSLRSNPKNQFTLLGQAIEMLMTGKYAFVYVSFG